MPREDPFVRMQKMIENLQQAGRELTGESAERCRHKPKKMKRTRYARQ